jgi:hypothetical protein
LVLLPVVLLDKEEDEDEARRSSRRPVLVAAGVVDAFEKDDVSFEEDEKTTLKLVIALVLAPASNPFKAGTTTSCRTFRLPSSSSSTSSASDTNTLTVSADVGLWVGVLEGGGEGVIVGTTATPSTLSTSTCSNVAKPNTDDSAARREACCGPKNSAGGMPVNVKVVVTVATVTTVVGLAVGLVVGETEGWSEGAGVGPGA